MTMRGFLSRFRPMAVALLVLAVLPSQATAGITEDVMQVYRTFYEAQNRKDLKAVRETLSNAPTFLWVSDGTAVWGADKLIERMAIFQRSDVWRVVPDLDKSVVVPLSAESAMMHIPLTLIIGSNSPGPDRLRFLVEVLCQRLDGHWKIAALLTTTEKSTN